MNRIVLAIIALLVVVSLQSCESATTINTKPIDSSNVHASDRALFIVCEGTGSKDGSIDALIFQTSPKKDTLVHRDILSGLSFPNDVDVLGNRAYVLENSGGIHVIDADSLTELSTIALGAHAANKMTPVASTSFLLTERASDQLLIVDVAHATLSDSIRIGTNGAEVGVLGGKAYVTISPYQQPGQILEIDYSNHQILRTRSLVSAPEILLVDSAHNQLIVGCTGDYQTILPVIYFIDPATLDVKDSITLSTVGSLNSLILGDRLYALMSNDITPFDLTTRKMGSPLLGQPKAYYDGIYDARNNEIYVGPYDFQHEATVDVIDAATGKIKWSFSSGIATGAFAFYH
jgi:DNA-binding beta-propeller fold protein YncE